MTADVLQGSEALAWAGRQDEAVAAATTAGDYLTKPARVEALVEALMQVTPRGAA